jgi:transcriptional regulator with XRE-family HTH domain
MDLSDYLDRAKSERGFRSERALSRELGVSHQSVVQWREGLATPRPETMLRLAELAGCSPEIAMLDHMAWRADGPKSRDIVARIRASIAAITAFSLLFFFVFPPSTMADNCERNRPYCVYYGKKGLWENLWKELLSAILN